MLPATDIVRLARILLLITCVATSATTARADAPGEPDADTRLRTLADEQDRAEDLEFAKAFLNGEDLSDEQARRAINFLLDVQEEHAIWDVWWHLRIDAARIKGVFDDGLVARYRRHLPSIAAITFEDWETDADNFRTRVVVSWVDRRRDFGDFTPELNAMYLSAILERQAAKGVMWSDAYGDEVESARESGAISDEQWDRYLRNMVSVEIEQLGSLPLGAPPRLTAVVHVKCGSTPRFFCTATHERTTIDGDAHWKDLTTVHSSRCTSRLVRSGWWGSLSKTDKPATLGAAIAEMHSDFRPEDYGEYPLRSEWRMRVVDIGDGLEAYTLRIVNATDDIDPQSLTDEPIGDIIEFPTVIEQTVEVRPNRDVKWIDDPAWEAKIRNALIERSAYGANGSVSGPVPPGEDPFVGKLDFFFDVYAVIDGAEHYIGQIYQVAMPSDDPLWDEEHERPHDAVFQMHRKWDEPNISSRGHRLPERADLILKPNRFIPTLWTHDTPAWGGEIRLEDVRLLPW